MQTPEVVESAFTAATTGAQRAINDLNHNIMKKVDEIFIEKISHKGTLTNLFGLNKVIDKKDNGNVPTRETEVQTSYNKSNAHAQTDQGAYVNDPYNNYYGGVMGSGTLANNVSSGAPRIKEYKKGSNTHSFDTSN